MTQITLSPNPPRKNQSATATVTDCPEDPFKIKVVYKDSDPPSTVAERGGFSNPPEANLGFTPTDSGDYEVQVIAGGQIIERLGFTVP